MRQGAAGVLRSRAGIGIAAVAALALLLAFTGMFALPNRSPDSVAVAGATTLPSQPVSSPVAASAPPAASASPTPTDAAPVTPPPSAPPSATPTPVTASAGTPVDSRLASRLQKSLDAYRAKTGIPGISVAIVWDDGRGWTGTSGKADVARGVPVTPDTGFPFASVSKTLTAAVVLQLVDEGLVELDAPASRYLPDYGLDPRISVRMLMDHRSSLPDFFANAKIDKALQRDKGATWTPARTWKYVPGFRPKPGTIYDYSNTNYLLLGELVEGVTGNPLATEVRARLLDPLQVPTAWYQAVEEPRVDALAIGYRLTRTANGAVVKPVAKASDVMPFRSVVTAAAGAGSIAGTATDAARWMQAFGSGRATSAASYREMIRDAKYTRAMRAIVTYGLGVQVITIEKQRTLGHSGRYLGFQNTVRYLRDEGISIAILTNQSTYDPAVLMRRLIRIVAPVKAAPGASGSPGAP